MRLAKLTLVFAAACGGGGSNSPDAAGGDVDAPTSPALRYEPWTVGSSWSYLLTDPKGVIPPRMNAMTTVMPMVDVGAPNAGTMALLVHIEKIQGSKDVLETPLGDLDVRYKTTFYDQAGTQTEVDVDQPYRFKLDESLGHVVAGAHYAETFTETVTLTGLSPATKQQTDDWSVVSPSEQVTVLAGTFTCLHVQRVNAKGTSPQHYWYARGVGKVKETGGGQDEELVSYTIAP